MLMKTNVYCNSSTEGFVPFQSVTLAVTSVTDELGISLERPIYLECKLNEPMHTGMRPEVLKELRTATDLALRATEITASSLGRAMVQERHIWLHLVDMRDADKVRFLKAPVSQTGLFCDAVESFAQQFLAAQEQTEVMQHVLFVA